MFDNKEMSVKYNQSITGVKKFPFREMEPSVAFHHQHGPFDLPKVVALKIQKTPRSPIHKTNNKPAPLEREQNKKVHKKKEMRWCSKFPSRYLPLDARNQKPTRKACWRTRSVSLVRFLFIATSSGSCNISSNRFSLFIIIRPKREAQSTQTRVSGETSNVELK